MPTFLEYFFDYIRVSPPAGLEGGGYLFPSMCARGWLASLHRPHNSEGVAGHGLVSELARAF